MFCLDVPLYTNSRSDSSRNLASLMRFFSHLMTFVVPGWESHREETSPPGRRESLWSPVYLAAAAAKPQWGACETPRARRRSAGAHRQYMEEQWRVNGWTMDEEEEEEEKKKAACDIFPGKMEPYVTNPRYA